MMLLKLICARVLLSKFAIRGAFAAGAVAGVIGLCALRRAIAEKRDSAA